MLTLLVDVNLSSKLAVRLREAGYDCQHWKEIGDPKAPDAELFDWAKRNRAVVITRDLGFSGILAATQFDAPSVVQVRCDDSYSTLVFPTILQALQQSEEQLRRGALVVVTENRLRIRTLPLETNKTKQ
jgi:predicted nuclease of predicted toxin-antitoxin system